MEAIIGYKYSPRAHLLVSDEDAADFLQSQFTNELRPLEAGRCSYGLWLDVKGKVLGDSVVLCEDAQRFRVLSPSSQGQVIADKLQQHIIADDVELELQPDCTAYALIGDAAAGALEGLGLPVPEPGRFVEQAGVLIYCGRRSTCPAYELVCLTPSAADELLEGLNRSAVSWVDEARIQMERLAAGYPLVPQEIGPGDLPGEGGLEQDAISFTKGCYLGQEVVARMHNLGRPQRGLFLLEGAEAVPELPIALYNADEKAVGELRSAYQVGAGWRGVGILKTRFVQSGDLLHCAGGVARVLRAFRSNAELRP